MMILKRETPTKRQILDYLAANPTAKDTARGIVEWWLLKQKTIENLVEVEAILSGLVAEGELAAHVGPDGQVHYFRPPGRLGPGPDNAHEQSTLRKTK